jgi:hypothetical protein
MSARVVPPSSMGTSSLRAKYEQFIARVSKVENKNRAGRARAGLLEVPHVAAG